MTLVRGIDVFDGGLTGAVRYVDAAIAQHRKTSIACASVHLIEVGNRDPLVRDALREALVLPDGAPVAVAATASSRRRVERVTGSSLFATLIGPGSARRRHFLYGSTEEVIELLRARLVAWNPSVEITGICSPPFRDLTEAERREVGARINSSQPDIVWIALGAPKQELWMAEMRALLDAPVLVAIGAAFEFMAGTKRRAPAIMQAMGLEWLFRLVLEPRRLFVRYLTTNTTFLLGLARDAAARAVHNRRTP